MTVLVRAQSVCSDLGLGLCYKNAKDRQQLGRAKDEHMLSVVVLTGFSGLVRGVSVCV